MILYHPFKDANHCMYRIISIMYGVQGPISYPYLNLADYYYLFPSEMKNIKNWPRKGSSDKLTIDNTSLPYESLDNSRITFFEIKEVRNQSIINLITKGIVTLAKNSNDILTLNIDLLTDELITTLEEDEFRKTDIYNIIINKLISVPLNGENGLKSKSGLMEHRYDKK
ncbi:MAG: hypothetical protein KAQ94_06555 [Arcobacteraceae bacterium]|nr:hypothetical protein [Arcobacteraceae bacterium]